MSKPAWTYVGSVMLLAIGLSAAALHSFSATPVTWETFAALAVFATLAQLFKAEAPNHILFYASPIFFFAGALLLPPLLVILLVAVPHAIEWIRERWVDSPHLRSWYLQPFNFSMYSLGGLGAGWLDLQIDVDVPGGIVPPRVAAGLLTAIAYVILNHLLLGLALVLARGVSWRESGVMESTSVTLDLVMALMGLVLAALWQVEPWYTVAALSPLVLIYQALMVPQLKHEANIDGKTGLDNARHFNLQLDAELERARRFGRPLALIMADLDLLRDINNTYGHLAGDVVLAGIGRVIRETASEYDVAGRFGGEEFAVVAPEREPAEAEALAERLRQAVAAARFTVATSAEPIGVTMSLGVAGYPQDGENARDLVQAADLACYAAKARGRNCVVCAADVPGGRIEAKPGPHDPGRTSAETLQAPNALPATLGRGMPADHVAGEASAEPELSNPPAPPQLPGEPAERSWLQWVFVATVIVAGAAVSAIGLRQGVQVAPGAIWLFMALAVLAEVAQVDLYGRGTVSVSVSLVFAAALLSGIPGVACVSAAVALAHHFRCGRHIEHLHRAAYNWATHVLAGFAPALLIQVAGVPLTARSLPGLAAPGAMAAAAYFLIDTGLVAAALSLSEGEQARSTWLAQYRWLAGHYVALCGVGLLLGVAYAETGYLGALVFTLPAFMMHRVQRQYVRQTKESMAALQRVNRQLSRAALTDGLTGLGNHRWFREELQRELERAARHGEQVALALINVDEFKLINDRRGQAHGDRILTQVAGMLRDTCRQARAFRVHGDEFALILPHTGPAEARTSMEHLRREVELRLAGATVSVGVAALAMGDTDSDTLQQQARAALEDVKRRGRNRVATYDEVKDSASISSSSQRQIVHRLISEQIMGVAFQPIWDVARGTVFAYEALARPPAELGLAGPLEAFDIAEKMGRAQDLDAVCRRAILGRAAELPPDALLFINISPQTLDHGLLAHDSLERAVRAAGLAPERVVLELTERSMARLAMVVRDAKRLRGSGFRLALDDTGAGNAGLEMLSQLPMDFIKVDSGVVHGALTNRTARAVLAGIISIASGMGAYVIAEGIETREMLDFVRQCGPGGVTLPRGVQGVQGYYLGRPSEKIAETPIAAGVESLRHGSRLLAHAAG